jgi:hypothetical protein
MATTGTKFSVFSHFAIFVFAFAFGSLDARAAVEVRFVDPARYSDEIFRRTPGSEATKVAMNEIARTLRRLGELYLPPGQILIVEVLDIQLAGYVDWWSRPLQRFRVLGTAGPSPRFKLRYRLTANNKVLVAREASVTDQFYPFGSLDRSRTGPLVYEKILLERWFRDNFDRSTSGSPSRAARR